MSFESNPILPAPIEEAFRLVASGAFDDVPIDNGWVLAHDTRQFLRALIQVLRPDYVAEFGSGLSTEIISKALKQNGPGGRVLSFDSGADFAAETRARLLAKQLVEGVEVIHAPVRYQWFGGKLMYFYKRAKAHLRKAGVPFDLALIDGPWGGWGREAALYALLPFMRPGGWVLVDDAARPDMEQQWIARWQDYYGPAVRVFYFSAFEKGLALIEVLDPQVRPAWNMRRSLDSLVAVWRQARYLGWRLTLCPELADK